MYSVRIAARYTVHKQLRGKLQRLPFQCRVRFGHTTPLPLDDSILLINTPASILNAADKLKTKQCFSELGVITAKWYTASVNSRGDITLNSNGTGSNIGLQNIKYPLVAKNRFGSRGTGVYLIRNKEEFTHWAQERSMYNYIFERFMSYSREYRIHATQYGYFYSCRKMLKSDTPDSLRWKRNDSTSVWIMESNPLFDKPDNWDTIVAECSKAVKACGLDFGACDVKIQSTVDEDGERRTNPKFFIIEVNSAPSLGDVTEQCYIKELPRIALYKHQLLNQQNS